MTPLEIALEAARQLMPAFQGRDAAALARHLGIDEASLTDALPQLRMAGDLVRVLLQLVSTERLVSLWGDTRAKARKRVEALGLIELWTAAERAEALERAFDEARAQLAAGKAPSPSALRSALASTWAIEFGEDPRGCADRAFRAMVDAAAGAPR